MATMVSASMVLQEVTNQEGQQVVQGMSMGMVLMTLLLAHLVLTPMVIVEQVRVI